MAANAIPAPVQTQLNALNTNVNRLIADRERILNYFEDGLGGSIWSFVPPASQQTIKNALVADMQAAVNNLQSVVNALAAL